LAIQPVFIDITIPRKSKPAKKQQKIVVPDVENRREHRRRVLKRATIINAGSISEIGCSIHNQTPGGAEINVDPGVHIPQHFLLYVPVDGTAYRSVVCWRRGERIGVQFRGTEPKPPRHYG
jgi:hypothetical protein